jgi:hypothetical protein
VAGPCSHVRGREIVAPELIVFVDVFADAEGRQVPPSHCGMSAGHPVETLVTVTFAAAGEKTDVTLRQSVPVAVEERGGMEQG